MSIEYRKEIDGLRAIAVMAVIFFHAELNIFNSTAINGGFLGVDVFFVISGYLISSIILSDLTHGRFRFREFYFRRIRRIMPILISIIAATIPLAWMFLLPKAMKEYSSSALSALLFSSNFWFWLEDSYWAEPSALKPLLHTWSLSLEEQFYILLPAFLVIITRFASKHSLAIITLVGIASLAAAEIFSSIMPDASFYLLPTRVWELFAGVALALLELNGRRSATPILNRFMPTLGAALVAGSFFLFDMQTKHPSILTAIPVGGTMLIIWFSGGKDYFTRLLKSRPAVWIGKISYGLYLWHFPIFAFGRMGLPSPTRYDKLLWIVLTVVLAVVTFFAIEKPARRSAKHRTVVAAIVVGMAALLAIQATIVANQGFPSRMPPILAEDFDQEPWKNMTNAEGQYCFADYGKSAFCQFGVGNQRGEVVLVGDSTLEAISASLVPLLVEQGYSVVTMNGSGCYYLPGFDLVGPGDVNQHAGIDKCDPAFQDKRRKRIEQSPNSIVILGGIFHRYLDGSLKEFVDPSEPNLSVRDGYLRAANSLLETGHTVIQLAPFPFFEKNPASQLRTALAGLGDISPTSAGDIKLLSLNSGTMDSAAFHSSISDASALFSSVGSPNMHVLFPHEIFCDTYLAGKCVSNDGEHLFFVDAAHPARAGAALIAAFIQRAVLDIAPQQ